MREPKLVQKLIYERINFMDVFAEKCFEEIYGLSNTIADTFLQGKKLLICGNGGSAADSQHLAAEFVSSFGSGLSRKSLPAIALSTDSSILTAVANDFTFDLVFARQVEGLGSRGDSLLALSTSGNSRNILSAVATAKSKEMKVLALTKADSKLYNEADLAIGIPSSNTQQIQECHVICYHIIAEIVEGFFVQSEGNK